MFAVDAQKVLKSTFNDCPIKTSFKVDIDSYLSNLEYAMS